jgi:hypothetical protein
MKILVARRIGLTRLRKTGTLSADQQVPGVIRIC